MSEDLAQIEQLASALLRNAAPPARRKLLGGLAREIRKRQSDRIAAQRQPDGSSFEPRRQPATKARGKKGRIRKRAMFRKLRLARHLKATATDREASVGFAGRASAIARIHQEGREDAPAPGMKPVRYARRVLLGLTEAERERILDLLLDGIAAA